MHDTAAPGWQAIWGDDTARRLWSVPDRRVVALTREWARDGDVRRILDLGCGVGRHAVLFARAGFEVYASDHSEHAVEHCREALDAAGYKGEVWHGEAGDIPQPDGFFDAAIAFNALYHGTAADLESAIDRLHAKLRPGGRCFVTLPSRASRMYGQGAQVEPHTFICRGMFHQLFAHVERGVPHHFCDEAEVRRLFRRFDLTSLDHEELWLPSSRWTEATPEWFKIPHSYFFAVVARARADAADR